jgi:ubiquitin carboxyl-terminal hydrolase 4/11/15
MWYCNKCKEHVRAWKQFHLYRTPPILIVHLKRFHYSASTHRRDKIDALIDFPLANLDLTSEVMHWSDSEKPIYDCYAVSNHYGGLGGGHYTAYALSDDGKWCHYDDSRVSTDIDPKEVVSNAAYVLYYKRRDLVFETPEFEPPLPAIVQDYMERTPSDASNLVRVDSMDLDDDRAVAGSPPSSNTSTSPMPGMSPQDEDDFEYETDHLPSQND